MMMVKMATVMVIGDGHGHDVDHDVGACPEERREERSKEEIQK